MTMTPEILLLHYDLLEQLRRDEDMLDALKAAAEPGAQTITDMPTTPGLQDRVGSLAAEIADLKSHIRFLRRQIDQDAAAVEEYVSKITDARIRVLFRLRFCRGFTWREIATIMGTESEEGIKKLFLRNFPAQAANVNIKLGKSVE